MDSPPADATARWRVAKREALLTLTLCRLSRDLIGAEAVPFPVSRAGSSERNQHAVRWYERLSQTAGSEASLTTFCVPGSSFLDDTGPIETVPRPEMIHVHVQTPAGGSLRSIEESATWLNGVPFMSSECRPRKTSRTDHGMCITEIARSSRPDIMARGENPDCG